MLAHDPIFNLLYIVGNTKFAWKQPLAGFKLTLFYADTLVF